MEWVSEWASQLIKVIRKMGNVLLLLAGEYAFGQQLANCVNWKTNENETKTDETFFFHSSSREEWNKNEHVNGLNDRERRLEQCQHFISSLFLSPNSMERKLWDSHLFMLLLCDSRYFFAFFKSIFFFFCFFKLFFPVPFHSAFFSDRFIVVVAIVEFFFAHSLWSF